MKPLPGWDGPVCLCEGVHRYSKTVSWIRLFIDVAGPDLHGCTCGAAENFEIALEDGRWMRFTTDLARTLQGEPVLRLRDYATWDVVYERVSQGTPIEVEIETIEDLALYLERCFEP